MYELPEESHWQDLIGQEVNQISVGPYDAQVAFEKGVVMQALHRLEGEVSSVRGLWFDGEWVTTEGVIHVPRKTVISISNESPLVLKVALTGDVSLFFHTEVSQYESINVNYPDGSLEVI